MLKFRKVRNKEEWKCTTNPTTIRYRKSFCPEGRPYEVYNGHQDFEWLATLDEAKQFAERHIYFNGTLFKR